jgi:F-type H+-transporting ATPase subunit epsilon/F-type H+-transporting ATPase subunit delta
MELLNLKITIINFTSSIFNLADLDKSKQQDLLKLAEEEASNPEINDQSKYLVDQKIEVLKSLN